MLAFKLGEIKRRQNIQHADGTLQSSLFAHHFSSACLSLHQKLNKEANFHKEVCNAIKTKTKEMKKPYLRFSMDLHVLRAEIL